MPLRKIRRYTSETVSRFSQETHLLRLFMNLKSQLPSAQRTKHLYRQWSTFLSWCITKRSQFRLSFNLFPELFPGFENKEAVLFSGVFRSGSYYQTVTLHTTNTSATFLWDQHPYRFSRPAFSKPNELHLRTLWMPALLQEVFVIISQGPSLLGVHRDTCWVPVPRGPGLAGTPVWHTGNKTSRKAPN